jgi:hypothetical protein
VIVSNDLLAHAVVLVRGGSEADARRAVSAGYYALFHRLASSGARVFAGAGHATVAQVARAFEHRTMSRTCKLLVSSGHRKPSDARLAMVAGIFVELQEERHTADYNLSAPFKQADAAFLVGQAVSAIAAWDAIEQQPESQAFLAALLLGDRLNRG